MCVAVIFGVSAGFRIRVDGGFVSVLKRGCAVAAAYREYAENDDGEDGTAVRANRCGCPARFPTPNCSVSSNESAPEILSVGLVFPSALKRIIAERTQFYSDFWYYRESVEINDLIITSWTAPGRSRPGGLPGDGPSKLTSWGRCC